MLSFSADAPEELHVPSERDGRLWQYTFLPQARAAHHHAEIELNLVTAGRATYLLGDRRYDLGRNSLVWLFPGQDHVLLNESSEYAMWIGVFRPGLTARVCASPATACLNETNPDGRFCRRLSETQSARLCALFGDLKEETETALFNAGLGYALLSAWAAYQAAEESLAGPDVHPAVERAARLLRDEADPLPMEQIAAQAGLSASRLSRLFHQQTGVALVEFRNRQRIQRFLRLYGRGRSVSMLDAALDAGFGSYPQFYRVFTRQMGCSPAAYRRRLVSPEVER